MHELQVHALVCTGGQRVHFSGIINPLATFSECLIQRTISCTHAGETQIPSPTLWCPNFGKCALFIWQMFLVCIRPCVVVYIWPRPHASCRAIHCITESGPLRDTSTVPNLSVGSWMTCSPNHIAGWLMRTSSGCP